MLTSKLYLLVNIKIKRIHVTYRNIKALLRVNIYIHTRWEENYKSGSLLKFGKNPFAPHALSYAEVLGGSTLVVNKMI